MSQYANFYIKNGNTYSPIGSFSRSSAIQEFVSEFAIAPWENGSPLTLNQINIILDELNKNIKKWKEEIKSSKKKIKEALAHVNENTEEFIEIQECSIREIDEIIDGLKFAKTYFKGLNMILHNVEIFSNYDATDYIYVGIEWCPEHDVDEEEPSDDNRVVTKIETQSLLMTDPSEVPMYHLT